jgi:hypothetical protein
MIVVRRVTARRSGILLVAAVAAAVVAVGCKEGTGPYAAINPYGFPPDFLPPAGVRVGTERLDGRIYKFHTNFRLFPPPPDIQPQFVFRDSVLALAGAGLPGADRQLLLRPDLSDTTLARVYATPDLFGFERSSQVPVSGQFVAGRTTTSAAEFYPVHVGNRWEINHNALEWTYVDSIIGAPAVTPPTANVLGVPAVRQFQRARARADRRSVRTPSGEQPAFTPAIFDSDIDLSVVGGSGPGAGIYFHAWRLIAERVVPVRPLPMNFPDRQRNPRFLWLSIANTFDPSSLVPVTVDQCLDALPAHLDFFPLKVCDDELREGTVYRTWTYLKVDDAVLRQRLNTERMVDLPPGGRCGIDFVVGRDTLRMFPTRSYNLLCRFDVAVERIVDQVTILQGETVLGRYPRTAAPNSLVKFRITMYVNLGTSDTPVQLIDLWLQRGIGPVIRNMGVFVDRRSQGRLRAAVVNGVVYPPDASNPAFEYSDGN